MERYLNDLKKIIKFYYVFWSLLFINLILIMLIILFGIYLLWIFLIISLVLFIVCTYILIKMHLTAKKYTNNMNSYYTFYFNDKYSYEDILCLIGNSSFIKDIYKYSDNQVLFYFVKKVISRILILNMEEFNKKEYDNIKMKVNRSYNKKINYRNRSSRALVGKKLRVNIIYLDKENEEIYKYLSNNIFTNFNKTEGTLNIAIMNNKMIVPSINDCRLWDNYNVIKYKIMLEILFKILNVVDYK